MKSVLKRIHHGISERSDISYSAAQTRVYQRSKGPMLNPYHSMMMMMMGFI
jgi:hypothetical protein